MPRNTLLLAILASSVLFLIGASPGTASAASCTSSLGATYFPNGDYAFPHYLTNCVNVNGVEFQDTACCNAYTTGWQNYSEGIRYRPPQPQNPIVYGLYYAASSYGFTWYRHRICNNANVVKVVAVISTFRIHNSVTGTWGSWYTSFGPNHDIWCYA
jgi:hypothetical protein